MLKVGFSRDPLQRLQQLHARFFRFFDLDRAFLIATDTCATRGASSGAILEAFADRRSPAPLVVPDAAAGYTEWHRGAYADAVSMAQTLRAAKGFALHAPLRDWLRAMFRERARSCSRGRRRCSKRSSTSASTCTVADIERVSNARCAMRSTALMSSASNRAARARAVFRWYREQLTSSAHLEEWTMASNGHEVARKTQAVARQRHIQRKPTRATRPRRRSPPKKKAVQAGLRSEPANPLPAQHLTKPGREVRPEPAPRFEAPDYRGSGKLEGIGRHHHRRRLGHRPRGRGAVCARRRGCRDRLSLRR